MNLTVPTNYYIDPARFEASLAHFAESKSPDLLNQICEQFFMPLAKGFVEAFVYGPVCRENLINIGAEKCWQRIAKYNPETGRAFNFFTKVIRFAVLDELRKESKRSKREVSLINPEEHERFAA